MVTLTVRKYAMVALSFLGSAILLFSCGAADSEKSAVNNEALMTERSEDLTILMSENGRRSYHFKTPLLEGYTLASDPYREFRKGIHITTYQNDSLTTVNATLVANYAIYYEKRELWEAKGDVVVEKADGTKLYTQQLFWNSKTGRIYSNVDSKIVKGSDTFMGEGFESDEELKEWRFRRMSGKMLVNMEPTESPDTTATAKSEASAAVTSASSKSEPATEKKSEVRKPKAAEKEAPAANLPQKSARKSGSLHTNNKHIQSREVPRRVNGHQTKGGERLKIQQCEERVQKAEAVMSVEEKTE